MNLRRSGTALAEICLAWTLMLSAMATGWSLMGGTACAQTLPAIPTTQVTDTVYTAEGTAAAGTVLIGWPAFSTWAGDSVPAGSTSVTIGTGGSLSVALVANAGSTPMGSYYTVVYHLTDGSVTREYWVVPVSTAAVAVSTIRSSVLPASVAMQTVSKAYVDGAIAAAVTGHPLDDPTEPYVEKAGDTMTGALVLPGDPAAPLQASDKNYVDEQVAGLTTGLGQKVSTLPQATQTVAQPPGTTLAVNDLNGVEYASQYVTGAGNNGIANATAACTAGCDVVVEQTYPSTEIAAPASWSNQTHVDDRRGGAVSESFYNPSAPQDGGVDTAKSITVVSTQSAPSVFAATGGTNIFSTGLTIDSNALAGGSNVYPNLVQSVVPYFKTTYSALQLSGLNNTPGQHVLLGETQRCYAVGDCLIGGQFMLASGGFRDDADEGSHPFDRVFSEDTEVFTGSCGTGCTTGSTLLQISGMVNAGTQGEGRYLINTNAAKSITAGTLIGGVSSGRQPSAAFSGTSFPVSVFLETAQTIPTQSNDIAPGTVTVPIATSGVPSGFATDTAALPANTGVACVSDVQFNDGRPFNFETAAYTVVDGTHLQMTLNRPHADGATVAVGGLCGYGLEQKVDTVNGIRQVFPVIGSSSSTSLLYAGGQTSIIGVQGLTSAYTNVSLAVASIARASNVVTVTTTTNPIEDLNGLTLTVANVADSSYNGSYLLASTGPNTFTYADSGADSTSSGGSLSLVTGAYGLYPMAEVTNVFNDTTKAVDGQLTLAANTVAWATGDPVELPHYFQEQVHDDIDVITQYTPRPTNLVAAGIAYNGNNGPGLNGWQIFNGVPASSYFGNGGTHAAPGSGMIVSGIWNRSLEMQAGENTVFDVHCNSHGCGKWNSTYDIFDLDSSTGVDRVRYAPSTSTLNFYMGGASYTFAPGGLTADTLNVNTLNAGTVHGLFEGTVGASSLPVFVASGAAHQQGAVPDPGATAGTTRFLREDGSWTAPTGGASGTGSSTIDTANGQLQADSVVSTAGFGMVTFGASLTQGVGCTTYALCWVNLVYNDLGYSGLLGNSTYNGTVNANFGLGGSTAADVSQEVFTAAPVIATAGNPILIDAGDELLNNILNLSGDTTQLAQQFKLAALTRLAVAAVDTVPVAGSLCTRTGTWSADTTFPNTPGLSAATTGATLSCTVAVGPSGVFYTWAKSTNSIAGSYSVAIDGVVSAETLSGTATQNVDNNSYYDYTYGVLGGRYTASPGYHTVTFTNVSGTTAFYAIAVPPTVRYRGVSGPKVYAGGVPPDSIPITAWTISSNVVTFTTGAQGLVIGRSVTLGGFASATFFNGQTVTVTGGNGLLFTAAFTHANGSGTEFGGAVANAGAIASYNAAVVQLTQQLVRDGLNVAFVDTNSVIDPLLDYSLGPVQNWPAASVSQHLSNRGHAHEAQIMEAVIGAAPQWQNLAPANIAVSNTATLNNLKVGNAYTAQNDQATFYDGNGDGNYLAIQAFSGDNNIHLVGDGFTAGSVYIQGNMSWIFTSPTPSFNTGLIAKNYQTIGNCAANATPANCYNSAAGSVAIPAASSTLTIDTTQVTALSQIFLQWDSSVGSTLGVTCSTAGAQLYVTARVPGTSFTIASTDGADAYPQCVSYHIVN